MINHIGDETYGSIPTKDDSRDEKDQYYENQIKVSSKEMQFI